MSDKNSKIALGKGVAKIGSVLMESLISYILERSAERSGITPTDVLKFEQERRILLGKGSSNTVTNLLELADTEERKKKLKKLLKKIDNHEEIDEEIITESEMIEIDEILSSKKKKKIKQSKATVSGKFINEMQSLCVNVPKSRQQKITTRQVIPNISKADTTLKSAEVWDELSSFNSDFDKSSLLDDLELTL